MLYILTDRVRNSSWLKPNACGSEIQWGCGSNDQRIYSRPRTTVTTTYIVLLPPVIIHMQRIYDDLKLILKQRILRGMMAYGVGGISMGASVGCTDDQQIYFTE